MNIIAKVISGGQTGVDIAALRAAKSLGIPTGGTMPKGFITLRGPRPDYASLFGLREHKSNAYPPRTFQNVADADITIRLAVDFNTAGERCTQRALDQYGRYQFDIAVRPRVAVSRDEKRPVVVNFAGNSDRTAPGIELAAQHHIRHLLEAAIR